MPEFTRLQLVLLELAGAAVAGGFALRGLWLPCGLTVGVVMLVLGATPIRRRWAYQLLFSYVAMLLRRGSVRGPGLQSLLGGYRVVTVPAGRQGATFGAVRVGATWTVPLELTLDRVLNDDAPVPVDQLAGLLRVEGVPLASVRLVTVAAPARRLPQAPPMPVMPAPGLVARYCLLTLDLTKASIAVASRGGSDAAVAQVLRRCVLRAEEVFSANGLTVRRLDEAGATALFPTLFGPAAASSDGSLPPTVETWRDIRVAGTWSVTFAVLGEGADVADRLATLATRAATAVAVTTLVLQPAQRGGLHVTLLLRVTGPGAAADSAGITELDERATALGLLLQRVDGEQGTLLRASTPVAAGSVP